MIKKPQQSSTKLIHKNRIVSQDNVLTLGELNTIFNQTFANGHLMVYMDGQLVFNATVTDDISTVIFEIIEKYLGVHELKVEFTDSENNTNTYTENVTIN